MAAMAAVIVFSNAAPSTAEPTVASTAEVEQRPGKEGKWSWVGWVATLPRLGDRIYPQSTLAGVYVLVDGVNIALVDR